MTAADQITIFNHGNFAPNTVIFGAQIVNNPPFTHAPDSAPFVLSILATVLRLGQGHERCFYVRAREDEGLTQTREGIQYSDCVVIHAGVLSQLSVPTLQLPRVEHILPVTSHLLQNSVNLYGTDLCWNIYKTADKWSRHARLISFSFQL